MSDILIFEETVGEDGKLVVQLPPNAPHGRVRVTVEKVEEEWAEIERIIRMDGEGRTMGEILQSPEIGAWKDRTDITDSVEYVEKMRREMYERRMKYD